MKNKVDHALELKVTGIIRPKEDSKLNETGTIFYSSKLMEYLINQINDSEIVKEQMADKDTDIFTGLSFVLNEEDNTAFTPEAFMTGLED